MDSSPSGPTRGPERFLRSGRLEQLPRRQDDRRSVVRLLATRVLPIDQPTTERELTARLAEVAYDPVGLRRAMVDAGLVTRTRDGAEYWRTEITEFDDGAPA
jgi:hypothetical protein